MHTSVSVKRGLALVLTLCLLLGCFAGCGRKKAEKPTEPETIPPQLMLDPTQPPRETTAPTTEPATQPTEAPTEPTKETTPEGMPGVVAGDSVNIRSGPSTKYDATKTVSTGDRVYILDVDLKTTMPWGKTEDGWICLNYVQLDNPDDLLQYTSSELGITMNKNIQLYNGPGTFYGKAGLLDKDVRLNIFGIVGTWARIAEGWLLVDHIYIDGTEGPEEPVMGTVSGTGVNIRSGPGTQYNPVTAVNNGTRLKIFYQVEREDYTWGCGEAGWICMDYVILDNDPILQMAGTWCGYNSTDQSNPTSHIFVEWRFADYGDYTCIHWIYDESMSGASEMKQTVSMTSGKYSFDGTKLIMDDKEVSYTFTGGKLYLDAGYGSKAHLKGSMDNAIDAFLKEKNPGSSTPVIDPAIVGTWSAARAYKSADNVPCFTLGDKWTFNSDGTFQLMENTTIWPYNEDGTLGQAFDSSPVTKSGTFTFDGTNLKITLNNGTVGSGTVSFQSGALVVSWGSGSQTLYKGSAEELAAKFFPNL